MIDLLLKVIPPNVIEIDRLDLAYNQTRILGNSNDGFLVQTASSSLQQIQSDLQRVKNAPFWLRMQDEKIYFGHDNIGLFKDSEKDARITPGFIEVKNASVEVVDSTLPDELLPPNARVPGRKAHKITVPAGGEGRITINFTPSPPPNISRRTRMFQKFGRKIGRNEKCPCGSGKKFKKCHGKQST
jgi:hypothetical protein